MISGEPTKTPCQDLYEEVGQAISESATAEVYKVIRSSDKQTFAKKVFKFQDPDSASQALSELQKLQLISHPNIVDIIDLYITDGEYLNVIMTFFDSQNLQRKIDKSTKNILQEKEIACIFFQICKAVYYIHSKNLIHRDLIARNILIDQNLKVLLIDLGQSKAIAGNRLLASSILGTVGYQSPEVLISANKHSYAADVWSLAVLLYQLCANKMPFNKGSTINVAQKIQKCEYEIISGSISDEIHEIFQKCFVFDPKKRPSVFQLLQTQFFVKNGFIINQDEIAEGAPKDGEIFEEDYNNFIVRKNLGNMQELSKQYMGQLQKDYEKQQETLNELRKIQNEKDKQIQKEEALRIQRERYADEQREKEMKELQEKQQQEIQKLVQDSNEKRSLLEKEYSQKYEQIKLNADLSFQEKEDEIQNLLHEAKIQCEEQVRKRKEFEKRMKESQDQEIKNLVITKIQSQDAKQQELESQMKLKFSEQEKENLQRQEALKRKLLEEQVRMQEENAKMWEQMCLQQKQSIQQQAQRENEVEEQQPQHRRQSNAFMQGLGNILQVMANACKK